VKQILLHSKNNQKMLVYNPSCTRWCYYKHFLLQSSKEFLDYHNWHHTHIVLP